MRSFLAREQWKWRKREGEKRIFLSSFAQAFAITIPNEYSWNKAEPSQAELGQVSELAFRAPNQTFLVLAHHTSWILDAVVTIVCKCLRWILATPSQSVNARRFYSIETHNFLNKSRSKKGSHKAFELNEWTNEWCWRSLEKKWRHFNESLLEASRRLVQVCTHHTRLHSTRLESQEDESLIGWHLALTFQISAPQRHVTSLKRAAWLPVSPAGFVSIKSGNSVRLHLSLLQGRSDILE